jgi:hypothetical protein
VVRGRLKLLLGGKPGIQQLLVKNTNNGGKGGGWILEINISTIFWGGARAA